MKFKLLEEFIDSHSKNRDMEATNREDVYDSSILV